MGDIVKLGAGPGFPVNTLRDEIVDWNKLNQSFDGLLGFWKRWAELKKEVPEMSNETLIPDTIDLNRRPKFPSPGPDEVIVTQLQRIEDDILYILKRMADRENGHENLAHLRKRIADRTNG